MSDQHKAFRVLQHQATVMRRQRLSLGHRLDKALGQAKTLTAQRGAGMERRSPSAENLSIGPGADPSLLYEPVRENPYEAFSYRATVLVELLEREVDAHRTAPVFGDATLETQEERDRRLLGYVERGLNPEVIDILDPAQGGVKAIRQALRRLND
jgi:hypothetical protein